ncbi:MAG: SMI1/KNR4 family protein [Flavobacteriaceae bacterium]
MIKLVTYSIYVEERFSNIIKLEKRVYQGTPKYNFNIRIKRDEIETFGKAYGIILSEAYIQFLERFNGGMILEFEETFYIDMTQWEPDGPKWSSFYFYNLNELIEKYRDLRLENWLFDEDFNGLYPIIPICETPGPAHNIIFTVSNKGLTNDSPVFSSVKVSGKYQCTKIARGFNTFLGYYIESDGFPALLPDDIEPSWQVFFEKNNLLSIANKEETYLENIAKCTAHLKLFPNNEWSYCERGNTHKYNGHLKLAIKDFNKAIELDDHKGFFYYCRGDLVLEHGNPRKALIDLDIAVNLEPDNKMFLHKRAEAFLELNMLEKALEDCNTVLDIDDKDIFALQTRIKVYNALGEPEKAAIDTNLLNSINY